MDWMQILEISGFITGIVCVWLNAKENIWGWPIGLISVICQGLVYFDSRLYSDTFLQGIFFITGIYGWYEWGRKGTSIALHPVKKLSGEHVLPLIILGLIYSTAAGYIFGLSGGSIPYLDASTTAISLIAQWMLAKKIIENWILWIIVDVAYTVIYIYKELYWFSALYFLFIILAIYGYLEWRKALKKNLQAG
jgi:nicotinamide mononucleotide transporter